MFHFSIKTFSSELKSTTEKTKLGHHSEVEADENTILYRNRTLSRFSNLPFVTHLLPPPPLSLHIVEK